MIIIKFQNDMQAEVNPKFIDAITKGMKKAIAMEAAAIKYLEELNKKPYPYKSNFNQ